MTQNSNNHTLPKMSENDVNLNLTIKNEEDLQEKIEESKNKSKNPSQKERFVELEKAIHNFLSKQDSDSTLTIITKWALALGSSDIHYDQSEFWTDIRLRIDWELETICTLKNNEYKLLLERLKYKSDLKLNINHIPQDWKYRITWEWDKIDVRVSTLPVQYWENIVCRILDSGRSIPSIDSLWFMWTAKRQIEKSLKKKNGTILVTGPTGSGKTTTLYSVLSNLNTPDKKIITLEDPIEYELPRIVQSEVNEKNGYTYATGLKALMRQDPDIIMIGEIRDLDSATIAMQAAMTWHLVLSTLHTKSSGETIERLMNMWVPKYILASGLDVIIAQRLVRRLCPHCLQKYDADPSETEIIKYMLKDIGIAWIANKKDNYQLYRATGCDKCWMTWYQWRIGVYEVMNFTDEIRIAIRNGASPKEIVDIARKWDLMLMREDWILKAMQWKTSLEELFKILD